MLYSRRWTPSVACFGAFHCVYSRSCAGRLFLEVVPVALSVSRARPRNRLLRARLLALLHRSVDALGSEFLAHAGTATAALLPHGAEAADVADVVRLVGQLAGACGKEALAPVLQELLPPLVLQCAS